ncbi:MAG: redoxin domain-containing protein [Pseudomonadota bacterium]|jgi:methylamine dehydrogenase accessory protein MauD|nr:redoxin domain-containing protein [Pseudomonadota bacterium]
MDILLGAVVALWILVLVLAVVVFALARQIGVLYERVAPAGALMINQQLKVGDAAPEIGVEALNGRKFTTGQVRGSAQLLFFLSPDCPICKTLLPVLKTMHKSEKAVEIVLMSDGEDIAEHESFVTEESLELFDYVISEVVGRSYGVGKLPYGVLIDDRGVIASLGIVNSREHLESLFEAKALGVASIQEYLNPGSDGVVQFDPERAS